MYSVSKTNLGAGLAAGCQYEHRLHDVEST